MASRLVHLAQLKAKTGLLEPLYELTISGPKSAEKGIYSTLRKRNATVVDCKGDSGGGFIEVVAYLPVRKSFGFPGELRANTHGEAFVEMMFSQWALVPGENLRVSGSLANTIVNDIRKRKGMPRDLPEKL